MTLKVGLVPLETIITSIPSVCIPTLSSGCSRIPLSIMSAMCFNAGAKSFNLKSKQDWFKTFPYFIWETGKSGDIHM